MSTSFAPPTLHVIIAEDDSDWIERLKPSFERSIKGWLLPKTGQCAVKVRVCRSYEEFIETGSGLLDDGDSVYATIDLNMPRYKREEADDPTVWRDMILWCLNQSHEVPGAGGRFDFCVISGDDLRLDKLFEHPVHGAELKSKGVKKVYKETLNTPAGESNLHLIWEDIREFVRKRVRFGRFPDPVPIEDQLHEAMIWFGDHAGLAELRDAADRIACRRGGGLFLMFSDAGGFEEDWFRYVCHLRGIDAPTILDISLVQPRNDPRWDALLRDPPEALLISHVNCASENQCDIKRAIEKHRFFSRIEEKGSLVFVQFPYFESEKEIGLRLDVGEIETLEACLQAVNAHGPAEPASHFAFNQNKRIVVFPPYAVLKAAEVIQKTIEFQAQQCQERYNVRRPLDPEVVTVLAGIPWDEVGSLSVLRSEIAGAYRSAAKSRSSIERFVGVDQFESDFVRDEFDSTLGFTIRGQRLFDVLDQRNPSAHPATSARTPLEGLLGIYELFGSLELLVELQSKLQAREKTTFTEAFQLSDYQALEAACRFLKLVFHTPDALRERIERFRPYAGSRRWREKYPSLRGRADWRDLVEDIDFVWPYERFRLPPAIAEYLAGSGVIAEMRAKHEAVLERYPELKERWKDLRAERRDFLQKLQELEEQRRQAEGHVREECTQPVLVLLDMEPDKPWPNMTATMQSFLLFNAYLAICEDHYRFQGQYCKSSVARAALDRPDVGVSINLLSSYIKALSAERLPESVFSNWGDGWAERKGQPDVNRLGADFAETIVGAYPESLSGSDIEKLERLRSCGSACPADGLLDAMGVIRNTYFKTGADAVFGQRHGAAIWDLLGRLVTATTMEGLRFGVISDDGRRAGLWARDCIEEVELEGEPSVEAGQCYVFTEAGRRPRFPIGELIRVDPANASVWAYFSRGRWIDLTNGGHDVAKRTLVPGPDHRFLPGQAEVRSSAIWRSVHGE
ncbi:hypothetical protein ACFL5Q_07215 [Planctomycetota bacterium]